MPADRGSEQDAFRLTGGPPGPPHLPDRRRPRVGPRADQTASTNFGRSIAGESPSCASGAGTPANVLATGRTDPIAPVQGRLCNSSLATARSRLRIVELAVSLLNGARNSPQLTVAFASDFHAGPTTDPEILRRACDALRASAPDVLLLGGDFVSLDVHQIDWLAPLLGSFEAPMGRFAVLGNHDLWYGADHIVRALEAAGIEMLTNRNRRLPPPFHDIWLCGLDEFTMGTPDARAALSRRRWCAHRADARTGEPPEPAGGAL